MIINYRKNTKYFVAKEHRQHIEQLTEFLKTETEGAQQPGTL